MGVWGAAGGGEKDVVSERLLQVDVVIPADPDWGDECVPEAEPVKVRVSDIAAEFELDDGTLMTFDRGELIEALQDVDRRERAA